MGHTAKHIYNFNIDAYRGLKDLNLQDLNDINILTGNNNSGKTSVLELLSVLNDPRSLSTWIKMCRLEGTGNYFKSFLNLFPTDLEKLMVSFSYDSILGKKFAGVMAEIQEISVSGSDIDIINGYELDEKYTKKGVFIDAKRLLLSMLVGDEEVNEYVVYDFQTRIPLEASSKKPFSVIYVSPNVHSNGNIIMDAVMESPVFYQKMMKILHEFDDSIINIVSSSNGGSAEYMVLSGRHKRAMPLSVYGDGMKKALVLLASVIMAKDGILLLDEFETAIHTSAMNNIFSWILQSAQKLNVQVFLSSHSLEAIGKVLRCDPGLQDKINLYTLYKKEGKNLVRKMNCMEAIKAHEDWGVELR